MVLQELILKTNGHDEMYARGGKFCEEGLFIPAGECASLDCYFNCLSYTKHLKYTSAEEISLSLSLAGEATVSLSIYDGKEEKIILTEDFPGGECTLRTSLLDLPTDGAILYPKIHAKSDVILTSGNYFTDTENEAPRIAIAICTYKREESVRNNLKILAAAKIPFIERVFVIDNGGTLDADELSDDLIHIVKNKNYGGSGGFTRGIIEAYDAGYSHVILMDDDIVIFEESLARMTRFVSILKDPYKKSAFSAAMLPPTKPYMQVEMGARFNGEIIVSHGQQVDVRERETLINNLAYDEINEYGAWWCYLMPLTNVDKFGLPYPFFIKFDDVEYGTRCVSKTAPVITMNGVAVAHEEFDNKYNMYLEYYLIRNQLITTAVNNTRSTLGCIKRLIKNCALHMFSYRYSLMPVIFRAYNDLLKGPDFLINLNEEELNREIMKMFPKGQPLSEIEGWRPEMREEYKPGPIPRSKKLLLVLTLGGHLIPWFMLKKEPAFFQLADAKNARTLGHKVSIQFQAGADTGYCFKRRVGTFFAWFFKAIGLSFKILFKYGKAKKRYIEKKEYLTSMEFWKKHLEI